MVYLIFYPTMRSHLQADAKIVQNSALGTRIVKVLDKEEDSLTMFENQALKPFLVKEKELVLVESKKEKIWFVDILIVPKKQS